MMFPISNFRGCQLKRNRAATKERILDAAETVLRRDGVRALGINAVCQEAGIGKPLIYRYFGGLGGLLEALADRAISQLGNSADSEPDNHDLLRDLILNARALAQSRLARDLLVLSLAEGGIETATPAAPMPSGSDLAAPEDLSACRAILLAGAHFLLLYRDRHDSWAGVPLATPRDMARLESAMASIVRAVFPADDAAAGRPG